MSTNCKYVIEADGLKKTYGEGDLAVHALKGIDLCIEHGEFVSIMGPSGSGKSTLLHVLACLHRPTAGTYRLDGDVVSGLNDRQLSSLRNQRVGIVFQQYNLLAHEDIVRNVELPMIYGGIAWGERRRRAISVLNALGLGERLSHKPTELSGGQDQRVAIARALVMNPSVIVADEPTGNLDSEAGRDVMAILQKLNELGRTIVMVTHDPQIALFSQRIVHLRDGRVHSKQEVSERNYAEAKHLNLAFIDDRT